MHTDSAHGSVMPRLWNERLRCASFSTSSLVVISLQVYAPGRVFITVEDRPPVVCRCRWAAS